MTPYDLEEKKRKALAAKHEDRSQMQAQIFMMLTVLLQHEADKEARHNIQERSIDR